MWHRPLGNPLEYAASSSRNRSACLSSVLSHNLDHPPTPLTHSSPSSILPRWSWETTSWRDSKLRAKPSVVNVNDEWAIRAAIGMSVPNDRDRSSVVVAAEKCLPVNQSFRSRWPKQLMDTILVVGLGFCIVWNPGVGMARIFE